AFSVATVLDRSQSIQITKSVSSEPSETRGSDTMGMKHRVDHGVYVFYGAMNPQLASKTAFSAEDVEDPKEARRTVFVSAASAARPEVSMAVHTDYWWAHKPPNGQYSSAEVHRVLKVKPNREEPKNTEKDYDIPLDELPGLKNEVL